MKGDQSMNKMDSLTSRISVFGWGLFLIWLGIFQWVHFRMGFFLLGVGAIILIVQAARRYFGLKQENFWLVAGIFFIIGGLWDLIETDLPLVPLLLIAAGAAMVVTVLWGRDRLLK